nr:MAG TPA: hypothetical protein [Caudoviricetes sp.]
MNHTPTTCGQSRFHPLNQRSKSVEFGNPNTPTGHMT